MCRAVWVIVVGATEESAKALRRSVGVEAQVVLVATDAGDAAIRSTQADVIVVDAGVDGAEDLVAEVTNGSMAIVWVGPDAPPEAHASSDNREDLSGALTKALLARRR